tara:strand:+ start:452 stop:1039 length:588 start_codon:yes stop_codon:yes gene_type:complete
MIIAYLIIPFISFSLALLPNNLPNRKYTINRNNLSNDLKEISSVHTSIIAKKWLENMVIETIMENKKKGVAIKLTDKLINREDSHIVYGISKLFHHIDNNTYSNNIYLAWSPNFEKKKTVLFLIHAYLIGNKFTISQIIQSPLWNSAQIQSIHLKNTLFDYSHKHNYELCLNKLYKDDNRINLSWNIWNVEKDNY